jgi:tetratricopeptide (TPR) repeat protein
MNTLAVAYQAAGKLNLALPLFEETLKLQKAKLGPDHPDTLTTMNNLALAYKVAGKLDLALPLYEETLKIQKAKLGPDHPHTLTSVGNLAKAYQAAGKLDLALPLFEETFKLTKVKRGPEHPETLLSMGNLAVAYLDVGKLDLALPLLEQTLTLIKAKLGAEHPYTLRTMNNLAAAYRAAGKLDLALPLFEETIKLQKAKLGLNHPDTIQSMINLVWVSQGARELVRAQEVLNDLRQVLPRDSPDLAGLLAQTSVKLLQRKQWAQAESLLRECLAFREKTQPDVWTTFNTQSLLGAALLGQKMYADSEAQLLKGYAGMKEREKTIPKGSTRIPEALDRLIELYTATNKPDEVKKWQAERAKYPQAKNAAAP